MRVRPVCRPERRSELPARPADEMGLDRRQEQNPHGGAPGRQMAGRQAGHGGRHRLEPAAGRRFEDRQPSVLHLGLGRQPEGGGQRRHRRRQAVHAGPVQVDGVPDRLCPAAAPLREGRRGGLREAADGLRPLHGGRVPARLLRPSQGEPRLLGRGAGLQDRRLQVRHRSGGAHRRDRERPVRPHAQHPVRGIRPAARQGRPRRSGHAGFRHRHDLLQRRPSR